MYIYHLKWFWIKLLRLFFCEINTYFLKKRPLDIFSYITIVNKIFFDIEYVYFQRPHAYNSWWFVIKWKSFRKKNSLRNTYLCTLCNTKRPHKYMYTERTFFRVTWLHSRWDDNYLFLNKIKDLFYIIHFKLKTAFLHGIQSF